MRNANRIAYALICAGGFYIMVNSILLGYKSSGMMGPGFFPFWIGLLLSTLSIFSLVKDLISKDKEGKAHDQEFASKEEIKLLLKVLGGASIAIIITKVTGFLIALGLLSAYVGKVFGIKKWYKILLLGIFIPSLLYLLFVYTFNVPIPKSILSFKGVVW